MTNCCSWVISYLNAECYMIGFDQIYVLNCAKIVYPKGLAS